MKWRTYLYAASLALLLVVLRTIQYKYLVLDLEPEYYVGILALFFTILGVWAGRKLTTGRRHALPGVQPVATSSTAIAPSSAPDLSPRELQVLELIAKGHSNQEIADSLFLSLNTIKKHTSSLFAKLEVKRRTQAIDKAKRIRLLV